MDVHYLSELLGYSSIFCWLGAQFPQILENIRRKSCEGLALPFLANWFLGPCTWLAVYFVFVDIMLISQYAYYEGLKPSPGTFRRLRIGTASSDRHYRTLSVVAANVSAAAALAAQQHGEHPERRRHSTGRVGSGSRPSQSASDEVDESSFAALAQSFHSEGGNARQHVSWGTDGYGKRGGSVGRTPMSRNAFLPRNTPADATPDAVNRGRTLQRDPDLDEAQNTEAQAADTQRRSSRAGRRGASLVFLSIFALFGVRTLAGGRAGVLHGRDTSIGRVLTTVPVAVTHSASATAHVVQYLDLDDRPPHKPHHDPIPADRSSERVIGRIFAWLCTTLYLTSRLPQIWKNYVRKSVEGLSMILFISAFLGNSFYVASILTSDKVLPCVYCPLCVLWLTHGRRYLLGSGGTLVFDITIVSQSFIYRRPPRRHSLSRSRLLEEEEAGLVAGGTLGHEPRGRAASAD
ncbi:PQ loop repeat-domain-containing protein [Mycena rebaudengoi]|nr:PQ loop repeat-domain-containing protein [Mycena rebaudengoi]